MSAASGSETVESADLISLAAGEDVNRHPESNA